MDRFRVISRSTGVARDTLTAVMFASSPRFRPSSTSIRSVYEEDPYRPRFSVFVAVHLRHADAGDRDNLVQLFFGWEASA